MSGTYPTITDRIRGGEPFACSDPEHERFFAQQALAQDRARLRRTYVLLRDDSDGDDPAGTSIPPVTGYYTLAAGVLRGTSRSPLLTPAAILSHFAVHSNMEGTGIAQYLLLDAFARVCNTDLAVAVIYAETRSSRAEAFAVRHGFSIIGGASPTQLVAPMALVERTVAASLLRQP